MRFNSMPFLGGRDGIRMKRRETTMPAKLNYFTEEIKFNAIVRNSITARYDGDLERHECPKTAEVHYTPLDTDHIRTLLNELWGGLLTAETIEEFFETLTEDGAEEWPHAWCEEDEEERPLSSYDEGEPLAEV
jgi:hypothetical protein